MKNAYIHNKNYFKIKLSIIINKLKSYKPLHGWGYERLKKSNDVQTIVRHKNSHSVENVI